MIFDIYKMHPKQVGIENRGYNYYFDNLIKAKKKQNRNKNVLINSSG